MIHHKIVIAGGGIAGLIAYRLLKLKYKESPAIIERNFSNWARNLPVFFLHRDISREVMFDFDESMLYYGIWDRGLHDRGNINFMNKFSIKTGLGKISENSIRFIDGKPKKIWLANDFHRRLMPMDLHSDLVYQSKIYKIDVENKKLYIGSELHSLCISYDYLIITIPMVFFLELSGFKTNIQFDFRPIKFSVRMLRNVLSNQCVYVVSNDYPFYRFSCISGKATFEYSASKIGDIKADDFAELEVDFLKKMGIEFESHDRFVHEYNFGRISPIDPVVLKTIYYYFTITHNIFFFGRNATWKYKRTEDLFDDFERIRLWIKIKEDIKNIDDLIIGVER